MQIFISKSLGRDTNQYDFSALYATAWSNAMILANIVAGFRVTSVFPFSIGMLFVCLM